MPGLSPYFQCVLTRPGRLDELTVHVEADPAVPEASYADLGRVVAARVKDRIGSDRVVDVVAPGSIERSVGKARRIVDRRH